MCTRYVSPDAAAIERHWQVGRGSAWRGGEVFPNYPGAFVRAARDRLAPEREFVLGQWSLIPWFAKERKLRFPTANARSEELAAKASYKQPWARGQRCVIPAWAFFEPNWESGRHVPWIFRRADGLPWGLAGLWNTWADPSSGEIVESYTMLTINADAHPLMRRMHRPDPKRAPELQDKRSVIPIEAADVDEWLFAPPAQARALLRTAPTECFDAAPQPTPARAGGADPADS
ncbi:MAG: SOS response-associated peptidase family protein [Burkholderiales bacterium]|nr:SOS response-associated peptidase family protein [Burkholderiales bacterium]MDE2455352.1 SOS response-associated peptidase family protein [Burkholderiales bacterium]